MIRWIINTIGWLISVIFASNWSLGITLLIIVILAIWYAHQKGLPKLCGGIVIFIVAIILLITGIDPF